ncbi:helix-turn-helix transcriptional regulator [Staphylococcus aureus]
MTLGQKLKQLRTRQKLSMEELADKLNALYPNEDGSKPFGKGKISKWEAGKVDPALTSIAKVAKFFNVSLDYLLGLEDENLRYPVVEVPILSNVYKNKDMYSPENIIGYYYIPNNLKVSHQKLIYIESDTKDRYGNKELALVNLESDVKDNETGLFIVKGENEAVIRKLQKIDNYIMVIPQDVDKNFKPNLYSPDDVLTIGKVISNVTYSPDDIDFSI